MADEIKVPSGWERTDDIEGGQPNGSGEIEPSDNREWFSDQRESHHRSVITLTGPWEEGARNEVALRRQTRVLALASHEEQILRQAREILARRDAEKGI